MKRFFLLLVAVVIVSVQGNAQSGTWSGKLDVQGAKLSLVFHLDGDKPTMDSPDQGAKGIPIQVERKNFGKMEIRMPSLGASFEGMYMMQQIVGTFKQMNLTLPLTLTPGEDKPNRPQTPQGPFPYAEEEVTFANGDAVLSGTLTLPEDCTRKTPVLLMVTGSGQQNRDEELFDHKPFAVIADAFARAGVATLRYDDRGVNGSSGNLSDCTTEDFKDDALAGVDFLRTRFDKVGVVGHSEGGTIAMMLAAENKVDFIISLAGMVVSGAETLVMQNRIALTEAGIDQASVDTYCKLIAEAFEVTVKGGSMPKIENYDLPDALKQNYLSVVNQIHMPYMMHFLSLDMRPLLDEINCPVLALNGTKDVQVQYQINLDALRFGLPANNASRIEAVEGVNHLFQHCNTGAVSEYREIEETISPDVLDEMIQWILEILSYIRA